MFIIGKYLNDHGQLKNSTIVSTVMSNLGFYQAIKEEDISSVKTSVGDRFVVEEMRKNGYNLGGEQSGHIVFLDHSTTGDGLLSGIYLMKVMKDTGLTLSELAAKVQTYPQKLINIRVTDKEAVMDHPRVQDVIAEVEAEMAGDGRVLVRASGTEQLLRVMTEAPTQETVTEYCERIAAVVREEFGTEENE